jgi:UTP-glucose-1-phosphate uridylyltransferase
MATLVVLAAGMGNRFGGLKQIAAIGPNHESILEYSLYDAIRAGFTRVVFVIRAEFESAFKNRFSSVNTHVKIDFSYQEIGLNRDKPWGTAHALLSVKGIVDEPFALINADDFYGLHSYDLLNSYIINEVKVNQACMVSFPLINTLSENGTVNRGICQVTNTNVLVEVVERENISRKNGQIISVDDLGNTTSLDNEAMTSMNCWVFHHSIFKNLEQFFLHFLDRYNDDKSKECYLPEFVNEMLKHNKLEVLLKQSSAEWFGITYRLDCEMAKNRIKEFNLQGVYPQELWK